MSEPEIDMDVLVEAFIKAGPDKGGLFYISPETARAILTAVLPLVLRAEREVCVKVLLARVDNLVDGAREAEVALLEAVSAIRASSVDEPLAIPADVRRLVVAARMVAFEDDTSPEAIRELDAASEAFADRVPWDDEPEEALLKDESRGEG